MDIQSTRDAEFVEFRRIVNLDDCKMHFTIRNWLGKCIIYSVPKVILRIYLCMLRKKME